MYDVYIRSIKMPVKVKGFTVLDNDGSFCVYVNSLISESEQRAAADHELRHIKKQHFYNNKPVVYNELDNERRAKSPLGVVAEYNNILLK